MKKPKRAARIYMPDNRLASLVLNSGGKTMDEAVADARARMSAIRDIALEGIETAVSALEEIVGERGDDSLSELQIQDILSYADRLLTLSDAFELKHLYKVMRSLADLTLGLAAIGVNTAEPIAVHVRAARLFAPSSPPIAKPESRKLLAELKRLVGRFVGNSPRPLSEEQRQSVLDGLNAIGMEPNEQFDRLTKLAARYFKVPIALISLIDNDRQWFMSKCGLDVDETDRDISFCAHAIMGDEPLVVLDASKDQRFAANPLVIREPHVRFYAGAPLISAEGFKLGTLCIIDSKPRSSFSDTDRATLQGLAKRIMDMIYARVFHCLSEQDPQIAAQALREASRPARAAARTVLDTLTEEVREPLNSIISLSSALSSVPAGINNVDEYRNMAQAIAASARLLMRTMELTLAASGSEDGNLAPNDEIIDVAGLLRDCASPYELRAGLEHIEFSAVCTDPYLPALRADRVQTEQMIVQLLSHAFRTAGSAGQVRLRAYEGATTGIEIEVLVQRGHGHERGPLRPDSNSPNIKIAERLMAMHGGVLCVSDSSDTGTRMNLTFPSYRSAQGAQAAAHVNRSEYNESAKGHRRPT